MILALRSIFFALLLPGTVTVLVPYLIVSRGGAAAFPRFDVPGCLSLIPISVGAGILFRCIRDFAVVGRGTLAPVDPPKRLVVQGLYRYVRNPMYVGVLCILFGETLLFRSIRLLCYATSVFVVLNLFVLFFEEPILRKKFGESYNDYCRQVRRWLPRLPRQSIK
jgi:protein-S-isoprenylcysteine O-methyltransferase Ste14